MQVKMEREKRGRENGKHQQVADRAPVCGDFVKTGTHYHHS
jgi:hypothetical protein